MGDTYEGGHNFEYGCWHLTYEASPEVVHLVVVGKAAFHDVEAVAWTRWDGRQTLAGWAGPHTFHCGQAALRRLHLGGRQLEKMSIEAIQGSTWTNTI